MGYCGFWPNTPGDLAQFLRTLDFAEAYSPTHLYTPDLWSGTERDLYRGLRRPSGIFTCWTHYAPWRDSEPYSRTVPWLWLFEEFNGVSYFDSAGSFAVLPSHMRTTHETRWWSEEVRLLQKGLAEQFIHAKRDTGNVRVVYAPGATGLSTWLRALNQMNIPYRVIASPVLSTGVEKATRLVILPDVRIMPDATLATLRKAAARGCQVIATAGPKCLFRPEGSQNASEKAAFDREEIACRSATKDLFGIVRRRSPDSKEAWIEHRKLRAGVPCTGRRPAGVAPSVIPKRMTGATCGEVEILVQGGKTLLEYQALGEAKRTARAGTPGFIRELFATPGAVRKEHGRGAAWFLTFQPDLAGLHAWLPSLLTTARIPAPRETVTVDGKQLSTVYLYPFAAGPIQLLGVVQDYWRVPPAFELQGEHRRETGAYFHHGPRRWQTRPAVLHCAADRRVYDCRTGQYRGRGGKVNFGLQPGRPEAFALLPYRITKIRIGSPALVGQGAVLEAQLRLIADGGVPGDHVLHATLTDPAGRTRHADRLNVRTKQGRGQARFQIPFNAIPGKWRLRVRDALTGVQAEQQLIIRQAPQKALAPLPEERSIVKKALTGWPAGKWTPFKESVAQVKGVRVAVNKLKRKRMRNPGRFNYQWHLTGGFSLANRLQSYELIYRVCDDWQANGWEKGRIAAPYPPGLGFRKPRPHMWYYNGYIVVKIDGRDASRFALTTIEEVDAGENGRVDVAWATPYGRIKLAFVMTPDHPGVFQELTVYPDEPVGRIEVVFRSYPQGFGVPGGLLQKTDPEKKHWGLTGNALCDRAYGKGMGPGAILVLPDGLDRAIFGRRPSLLKIVDASIKPKTGPEIGLEAKDDEEEDELLEGLLEADTKTTGTAAAKRRPKQPPVKLHWILWMFPELSNAKAEDYMRRNAAKSRKRLVALFPEAGAQGSTTPLRRKGSGR